MSKHREFKIMTRDQAGELLLMFLSQSAALSNALIDTLPRHSPENASMAFADYLLQMSELARKNGGKIPTDAIKLSSTEEG